MSYHHVSLILLALLIASCAAPKPAGVPDPDKEMREIDAKAVGESSEGQADKQTDGLAAPVGCETAECDDSCEGYSADDLLQCAEDWRHGCFSDIPPEDYECRFGPDGKLDLDESNRHTEEQDPSPDKRETSDDTLEQKAEPLMDH